MTKYFGVEYSAIFNSNACVQEYIILCTLDASLLCMCKPFLNQNVATPDNELEEEWLLKFFEVKQGYNQLFLKVNNNFLGNTDLEKSAVIQKSPSSLRIGYVYLSYKFVNCYTMICWSETNLLFV